MTISIKIFNINLFNRNELTVHDSADEQPHFVQSTRASKSPTIAGLAMAHPTSSVKSGIVIFMLTWLIQQVLWDFKKGFNMIYLAQQTPA